MNLLENEEKFLLRFKKYIDRIFLNYIVVGLSLCITIAGLIVGIKFESKDGFLIAIFFGVIGCSIFIVTRVYQRLYKIIFKMKQYIAELDEKAKEMEKQNKQ